MRRVFKRIFGLERSIAGSALIIGIASVASRVLGLVRDRVLSTTFGAGPTLDSYFAAFKIPDLFFNLIILGALSGTFVPLFTERKHAESEEAALRITSTVVNGLILMVSFCVLIGVFCAPYIIHYFAFGDSPQQQQQIVQFVRIMSLSLIFFSISSVSSFLLNAYRRFVVYALAPIFYNVGIIFAAVVLVPFFGVYALPWGVVIGSFLHMVVQIPEVRKIGFRWRPKLEWRDVTVRKMLIAMPGRSLALGLAQISTAITFAFASAAETGARTAWQFADNLQNFPINIFGASLALAAFPVFSEAFSTQNSKKFVDTFIENTRRILFFIIPIALLTVLLRAQVVRLVYGAGKFGWDDTSLTAQTLGVFALSMFAQALIPLCTRAFFAEHKARIPITIAVVTLILNIILSWTLVGRFGVLGLAAANSACAVLQLCILFFFFRLKHELDDAHLLRSISRIVIASIPMVLVVQGLKYTLASMVNMQTVVGVFTQTALSTLGGCFVYLVIAWYFRFPEARAVMHKLRQWSQLLRF